MSYYWVGDKPITALVIAPARDLAAITAVTGLLIAPDGTSQTVAATIDAGSETITVQWPTTALDQAGLWRVQLTLTTATGRAERLDSQHIVVQTDDGWHTLGSARSEWSDAPESDVRLWVLLEIAKTAIAAFAPALPDGALPTVAMRQTQLMQARNTWNAARVDPASGDAGGDGFALTPFPLDWQIKQILRPKNPRPVAL